MWQHHAKPLAHKCCPWEMLRQHANVSSCSLIAVQADTRPTVHIVSERQHGICHARWGHPSHKIPSLPDITVILAWGWEDGLSTRTVRRLGSRVACRDPYRAVSCRVIAATSALATSRKSSKTLACWDDIKRRQWIADGSVVKEMYIANCKSTWARHVLRQGWTTGFATRGVK